jgi:hypothetical protein
MKSRKDAEMVRAYDRLVKRLNDANIHPHKHMLDNEISANMKEHIKKKHKFIIVAMLQKWQFATSRHTFSVC